MAKKSTKKAKEKSTMKQNVFFEFMPSVLIKLCEFINGNLDLVNDKQGGVEFKTRKGDMLFKINDILGFTSTQDGFITVELKPDEQCRKKGYSMYLFNKNDIEYINIDYETEIFYMNDRIKKDAKKSENYTS